MTFEVKVEPAGVGVNVAEGQTILDAALRAGVYLPHACGHGLCATCKVEVLEGEVDHGDASPFALMDIEKEEGLCLACTAVPLEDVVIEADVDEDPDARNIPVRDFICEVVRIETLSPRILGIWLSLEGDGLDFQAGQYLNLSVPGVERPRAFSVASPPSDPNLLELNVCIVPGGEATTWLHRELTVGAKLNCSGPYGHFFARQSRPEPMIFFAGGSGLSSPRSMILDLLAAGDTREITLLYGARNVDDLYYQAEFEELARRHEGFTYVPVLSEEPEGSDWEGERGFLDQAAVEHFGGRFAGNTAYMCGPPPMIDACVTTLMRGRLFERDMYTENFFDQSNAQSRSRSPLFKSI